VRFAEELKKHVSVPVGAIGALNEAAMMEEIIASGRADVVYMARALLADPELPRKIIQNRCDEILKCVRCFTCLAERMQTQTRICAVNPMIGREYESLFERSATRPKKALVAGGGVGGMQAALTAAERGHRVVLCEKSGELGGALLAEKRIPFKKDVYDMIGTFKRRLELAGVELRLNTEVTAEYVRQEEPDVLVVAVGAEPLMPIKGDNVVSAGDVGTAKIGKTVVVLGGGLVGCETAVHLAMQGHDVTLAEMTDSVAADANARQRPALVEKLYGLCRVLTGVRGLYAEKDGLCCENGLVLKADTIVVAAGQRPRREVVDGLRNTAPEVKFVGDCVKAANIREAVFAGYHAGMDI
jgi:NADPH-dependent 2,4-dienoyl-CoA reductase/sulfur reductase-like enzyme